MSLYKSDNNETMKMDSFKTVELKQRQMQDYNKLKKECRKILPVTWGIYFQNGNPVQKESDLGPGKKSCIPGGAQFLIPFKVGPL
jgi:hypothetical protein